VWMIRAEGDGYSYYIHLYNNEKKERREWEVEFERRVRISLCLGYFDFPNRTAINCLSEIHETPSLRKVPCTQNMSNPSESLNDGM